ncbi:MAG: hypothetical protein MUE38_06510 [Flavihumibacter sp.]|jgi:hypothetical protein|nr:hypothetical protein [Flavihumibacter sp.]
MKLGLFYSLLFIALLGCEPLQPAKPVLVKSEPIFYLPADTFLFRSSHTCWNAYLLSFTQPLPLACKPVPEGFSLSLKHRHGVTEGPAILVVQYKNSSYYYHVLIQNNSIVHPASKDYRSPKTVNTDSSLQQQQILHVIDEWRNLLPLGKQKRYFEESILSLEPKAGTFLAQKKIPLSAYYVQPGSPASIFLKGKYLKKENVFEVTAGPLQDKYGNQLADGTMIRFLYTNNQFTSQTEVAIRNGMAILKIPAIQQHYTIQAAIHTVNSNTIKLYK